jgi:hypothetical protein
MVKKIKLPKKLKKLDRLVVRSKKVAAVLFAASMVFLIAASLLAIQAYSRTDYLRSTNTLYSYTHTVNYDYIAKLNPNTIYNTTEVGPGNELFFNMVKALDISLIYSVSNAVVTDGLADIDLILESGTGWTKTISSESLRFNGSGFSHKLLINLTEITNLVKQISSETRTSIQTYQINLVTSIKPKVKTSNNEVVNDSFSATLPIKVDMTRNKITVGELEASDIRSKDVERVWKNYYTFLATLPVSMWKQITPVVVAVSLATFLVSLYTLRKLIKPDEIARLEKKYKNIIVDAIETPLNTAREAIIPVEVGSLDELIRLSNIFEKPILRRANVVNGIDKSIVTYFLIDGHTVYFFIHKGCSKPEQLSKDSIKDETRGSKKNHV